MIYTRRFRMDENVASLCDLVGKYNATAWQGIAPRMACFYGFDLDKASGYWRFEIVECEECTESQLVAYLSETQPELDYLNALYPAVDFNLIDLGERLPD